MPKKPVIFSGLKPSGNLNVGTYLGAAHNWVGLQNSNKYQLYIFIADLHSLTTPLEAKALRAQTLTTAAELIATGIDPAKTTLFIQSHVPEHTELAWILSCVTPVAELQRMTQFKDKSQKQAKNINAGLLNYPILQAADILLYHGTLVPVGQDQIQHVELTRDIAHWFNTRYGEYFPEVKHLLTEVPKVMGLLEPTKKMSKSDGAENVIELSDEPEVLMKKIKKAVTATAGGGAAPGVANLLSLLKHFGAKSLHNKFVQAEKTGDIRYGELKQVLAESVGNYFTDFRTKRAELLADSEKLTEILEDGAARARTVAQKTMKEVGQLIGVR